MSLRPVSSVQLTFIRISFLHMTFAISFVLVGGGIVALPLDWQLRGGLAAGLVALLWSSFTLADTMALLSRGSVRCGRRRRPERRRA
ncbi:YiaA/YiaB family inner membrane protein [Bradyrhizobium sp.]|uniref:Uncharacterized protein n=1 Tax=Bradyrhizobium denitrificans TaxID=2734912 RepID=A0ABS5G790_9BRAD|nr:YiaA/YiaB family inner membrane protein [Bradyrhizobium sp.]MBR1137190.1 hypothetical protein [Bradyrhizobium denitrificans]MDU6460766.1 YiaA/YiaB family inner membrane protein [Bradyrhizobium sp.]